jgi:sn-glycerol 3-phosphate transport system permease protein
MTSISQSQITERTTAQSRSLAQTLKKALPERWYAHIILIIAILIMAFPLFYALLTSTQENADIFRYQITPGTSFLRNWDTVMNRRNLMSFMLNSTVVAVSITAAKTLLSLLAGLAFVYFRFPGKWIVFGFVLITLMMPTEILIIALYRFIVSISKTFSLGDNYMWALIVPFMASATGSFLFRQHFSNIPAELSEAAQLDGATPLQFLFRVLVPISWNTIGALAVIQFIYAWNMYLWPATIIQGLDHQVIQVGLAQLLPSDTNTDYGPLMLAAVIASIPPIIVFILLQKQFMSGFAITRDK